MEKPDYTRCQAEVYHCHPFRFGPSGWVRCSNSPSFIAMERKVGEDGEIGSMALCEACKEELLKTKKFPGIMLIKIKEKK